MFQEKEAKPSNQVLWVAFSLICKARQQLLTEHPQNKRKHAVALTHQHTRLPTETQPRNTSNRTSTHKRQPCSFAHTQTHMLAHRYTPVSGAGCRRTGSPGVVASWGAWGRPCSAVHSRVGYVCLTLFSVAFLIRLRGSSTQHFSFCSPCPTQWSSRKGIKQMSLRLPACSVLDLFMKAHALAQLFCFQSFYGIRGKLPALAQGTDTYSHFLEQSVVPKLGIKAL